MYNKRQCRKIVEKLSQDTGFLFPKGNVLYKQTTFDKYFFEPDKKTININTINDNEKDIKNGEMYFSISHEYGHVFLDFILKNNITKENVQELTIDKYTSMLQTYFNNKKIKPTITNLNNFSKTVRNTFALEDKNRNILLFDNKYYISSSVNSILYANNTVEIFANIFAMKEMLKFENKNNTSEDFMVGFVNKLMYATLNIVVDKIDRQKSELYTQISTYYKHQKIMKSKQEIQKEIDACPKNFVKFYSTVSAELQNLKLVVLKLKEQYPTKRDLYFINAENKKENQKIEYSKLQIQQLVDTDSRVLVIDNFKPHIDDKFFKIEQENIYSLASLARANLYNIHPPVCEVIIDTEKCILYCFQEPHHIITTTELEEEVLSDSAITSLCDIVEENEQGKVQEQNYDRNDDR